MQSAKLAIVPPRASIPPPAKEHWFAQAKDGSVVFNGSTYDDHVDAWGDAQIEADSSSWAQAQIAASLLTKYGDQTVKRFAHDVKRSARWIWDIARAYRVFEKCSQLHYLSFTHHVEAAKAAKDGDNQAAIDALNKAHDGEWSVKELQRYIETGLEPGEKSEIDAAALALATVDMDEPAADQQVVKDRAMIAFLMESRTVVSGLKNKCPHPNFSTDVLDSWIGEIDDHLEQLTLGVLKEKVIKAWKDGYRQEPQIASVTNIPIQEIHSVMKAYEREGVFEKIKRAKTKFAKGTSPWIWHLVGEAIGTDAHGREFKRSPKKDSTGERE